MPVPAHWPFYFHSLCYIRIILHTFLFPPQLEMTFSFLHFFCLSFLLLAFCSPFSFLGRAIPLLFSSPSLPPWPFGFFSFIHSVLCCVIINGAERLSAAAPFLSGSVRYWLKSIHWYDAQKWVVKCQRCLHIAMEEIFLAGHCAAMNVSWFPRARIFPRWLCGDQTCRISFYC